MYILAKRLYPGDYYVRVYTEDGYYAPGVPYTLAVFRTPAVGLEVK